MFWYFWAFIGANWEPASFATWRIFGYGRAVTSDTYGLCVLTWTETQGFFSKNNLAWLDVSNCYHVPIISQSTQLWLNGTRIFKTSTNKFGYYYHINTFQQLHLWQFDMGPSQPLMYVWSSPFLYTSGCLAHPSIQDYGPFPRKYAEY